MRGNDLVGRLGGEEFAVIVPEPIEIAERIAERLRAALREAGVMIGDNAIGATVQHRRRHVDRAGHRYRGA